MSEAAPHSPACGSKSKKATNSFSNFAISSISLFSFSLLFPLILYLPPATVTLNPCDCSVLSHVEQLATHCVHSLLMNAYVPISSPRGASIQARALLDSASSSFISEHSTVATPTLKAFSTNHRNWSMSHESISQVTVHFQVLSASKNGFEVEV